MCTCFLLRAQAAAAAAVEGISAENPAHRG